jgi:hypothetical protein
VSPSRLKILDFALTQWFNEDRIELVNGLTGIPFPPLKQGNRAMSETKKQSANLATMRVIELVGESKESWEDAAQRLVKRESAKHKNITGLDVLRSTAVVREGKIVEYRIDAKMAYAIEPDQGEE